MHERQLIQRWWNVMSEISNKSKDSEICKEWLKQTWLVFTSEEARRKFYSEPCECKKCEKSNGTG